MTMFGLADNANYQESTLTKAEARESGIDIRRTIVMPSEQAQMRVIECARLLRDTQVNKVETLVVVTTESASVDFSNLDGYCDWLDKFCAKAEGVVYGIELQNELDTPSWGITNDQIVEVAKRGAEVVHKYNMKAFAPSLLSGPAEGRFEYIAARVHGDVDFMTVHPYYRSIAGYPYYGWRFGTIEEAANECEMLCPWIPTSFSELGCPVVFDGITEKTQRSFVSMVKQFKHRSIHSIIFFCRDDHMVPVEEIQNESKYWGTIAIDNRPREAAKFLFGGSVPEYVLGFKEWYDLEPELLGEPVEDEHGGINGLSQQLTERGLLTWAALADYPGGMRTFYEFETRKRRALAGGAQFSIEI